MQLQLVTKVVCALENRRKPFSEFHKNCPFPGAVAPMFKREAMLLANTSVGVMFGRGWYSFLKEVPTWNIPKTLATSESKAWCSLFQLVLDLVRSFTESESFLRQEELVLHCSYFNLKMLF